MKKPYAATAQAIINNKKAKHLSLKETSTILFALRYLQDHYVDSQIERSEYFNFDVKEGLTPLTVKEIDGLCETVNGEVFYG